MTINLYSTAMSLYKFLNSFFGAWWDLIFIWIITIPLVMILIICVMAYRYKKGMPLLTPFGYTPRVSDHILWWGGMLIILIGTTIGIPFSNWMEAEYKQYIEYNPAHGGYDFQLMYAAKKMLQLTGFEETLTETITKTVSVAMANVQRSHPGLDEKRYQDYGDALHREMKDEIPGIIEKISSLYAEQYTLKEFGLLNAFYSSPVGKKGKQVEAALGSKIFDINYRCSAKASQIAGKYLLQYIPLMSMGNSSWDAQTKTGMVPTEKDTEGKIISRPEHLAAARKYLDLAGYENILDTTLAATVKLAMQTIKKIYPNLKKEVYEGYGEIFAAEMRKDIPGNMDEIAALYAEQYTLSEFKEMNAFFSSPIGKKSKQVDTKLSDVMMEILQKWALQAAEKAASCVKVKGFVPDLPAKSHLGGRKAHFFAAYV